MVGWGFVVVLMSRHSFPGISSPELLSFRRRPEPGGTPLGTAGWSKASFEILLGTPGPEESLCGLAMRWLSSPFCSEIHQGNLMVGNTKIRHNVISFLFSSPMLIYIQILLSIQGSSEGLFPHVDIKSRVWVGSLYMSFTPSEVSTELSS